MGHTDATHVKSMAALVIADQFKKTLSTGFQTSVELKVNSVKAEKDVQGTNKKCKEYTTYSHWSECSEPKGTKNRLAECGQWGVHYRLRKKAVCKKGSNVPMIMKFTQKGKCKTMNC